MPPKRKRTGAGEATTRTSSRLKAASHDAITIVETSAKSASGSIDEDMDVEPVAKKTKRTTKAASSKKTKAKSRGQSLQTNSSTNETVSTAPEEETKPSLPKNAGKPEPYSEARARELFKMYEDPDTPGEIGSDGFEKLCGDLNIPMEGALPLVLAWQMHGTEIAKFKESEWMQGCSELRASSLQVLSLVLRDIEDLLFLDNPPIPSSGIENSKKRVTALPSSDSSQPYDRVNYYRYAADKNQAFSELYSFCFNLAKTPSARNIDMEIAIAFWSVLLAPKYDLVKEIIMFVNEKGTYKGVNKDLWNMVFEFARTIQNDLSNYEADGAWPTLLDDFAAWKKAKSDG